MMMTVRAIHFWKDTEDLSKRGVARFTREAPCLPRNEGHENRGSIRKPAKNCQRILAPTGFLRREEPWKSGLKIISGMGKGGGQNLVDLLLEVFLRDEADPIFNYFAFLHDEGGRDGLDLVVPGKVRILVDVNPHDLQPSLIFLSHLVHDGSVHTAGTAPGGPKIDQYGFVGFDHFLLEGAFRHGRNVGVGRFRRIAIGFGTGANRKANG